MTTKSQFRVLIELMEENPEIAKGMKFAEVHSIGKEKFSEIWQNITNKLNSLGPPQRSPSEWQKVSHIFKLFYWKIFYDVLQKLL